jgi:hypothetical protein
MRFLIGDEVPLGVQTVVKIDADDAVGGVKHSADPT